MKNSNHDLVQANEERAKRVLVDYGILQLRQPCPKCGTGSAGQIRRGKFRCRTCGREWGLRKGSILDGTRISFQTFLTLVQLYADDVPAHDAAGRLQIAYNTVNEIYARIGNVISGNHLGASEGGAGVPAATEAYGSTLPDLPAPSHAAQEAVVFGIRSYGRTVTIEPVQAPHRDIITALPVPAMQRGNILFIDAYGKKYQGFITYDNSRHGREVVRIRARDNFPWSPLADFWTFAGTTWKRHRGIARERMPEFIRELEFRFNNRDMDLYPLVLRKIAAAQSPPERS